VDHYPPTFRLWVGLGVLAMLVAIAGWSRASQLRKLVAVVTVPLTLAAAFVLINSHYAYWPTVGDLLGRRLPNEVSRQALTNILQGQPSPIGDHGSSSLSPSGPPIERSNGAAPTVIRANSPSAPPARRAGAAPRTAARATASAPTPPLLHGVLAPLDIPPGTSGFAHRQGTLYLPPGFSDLASERLPVLVMLGGAPGGPQDWARGGYAAQTADAYATEHHGLAPILAFVDENGSATADTECVDGPGGQAETFLAVDVPRYLSGLLHVPLNPGQWGVGGFSEGGTCGFELAVRHPDVYGTFVDIAGDRAPHLGSDAETLKKLYGGDRAAMAAHDPAVLLRSHRFDGLSGWFVAGSSDPTHTDVAHRLAGAARAAGITVSERIVPGQHNWAFAATAFRAVLPAVAAHFEGGPPPPTQTA